MEDSFNPAIVDISEKVNLVNNLYYATLIFSVIAIIGITIFYLRKYYTVSLILINLGGYSFLVVNIIIIYFIFLIMSNVSDMPMVYSSNIFSPLKFEFFPVLISFISVIFSLFYVYFSTTYTFEFYKEIKKESNALEDEISKLLNKNEKDTDKKVLPLKDINSDILPGADVSQGVSEIDNWLKKEKQKTEISNNSQKTVADNTESNVEETKEKEIEEEPVEVEILPEGEKEEEKDLKEEIKEEKPIVQEEKKEERIQEPVKYEPEKNITNSYVKKEDQARIREPVLPPTEMKVGEKIEIKEEKNDITKSLKEEKVIEKPKIEQNKEEIKSEVKKETNDIKPSSKELIKTKEDPSADPFKSKKVEKKEIIIDDSVPPSKTFDNVLLSVIEKQQKIKNKSISDESQDEEKESETTRKGEEEKTEEKIKLRCPKCKNIFSVNKTKGKITVQCPHCGKTGEIE